jgi:hypothetical protein
MFLVNWSFGKQRRRSENAVKLHLEEKRFDDLGCLHIISGKIRGFIISGFKTSVSVTAVLIILYACAEVLCG